MHTALGPQGDTTHGLIQWLFLQVSLTPQSSSEEQPKIHELLTQIRPRKQSLVVLQETGIYKKF